jgi:O-succinylbenzoic acid--CoA ligase
MKSLLHQAARQHADAVALVTPQGQLSYRDYYVRVLQAAANLERIGVKRGEALAVVAGNQLETILLMMAVWEIGAVAVPVSPRFPVEQVVRSLEHIKCSRLVVPQPGAFDPIETYLLNDVVASENDRSTAGFQPSRELSLDQNATILFTSGTTKFPKAVLHTLGNHYFSALGANENIPFAPGDCWLLSLPLYHVGGLAILVRALVGGGAVVVANLKQSLSNTFKHFDISHLSLVPTQLYRMMQDDTLIPRLQKLKAILLGGSDIPPALIQQAIRQQLPIHTTYGSTEMSSQTTTTRPHESPQKLSTAGRLLSYRKLKIAADGEILVRGKTLFEGYIAAGGTIESPVDGEGWFATGDIGTLDADGYLTVLGRKDNMFISGGENICPEEIEMQIQNFPGVVNAIVVSVKNVEFGSRPVAFVQTASEIFEETTIRKYLESRLPRFKIPDRFFPWPQLDTQEKLKYNRQDFIVIAEERMKEKAS